MALGDRLYGEVFENKPPAAYGLVGLFDLAPGRTRPHGQFFSARWPLPSPTSHIGLRRASVQNAGGLSGWDPCGSACRIAGRILADGRDLRPRSDDGGVLMLVRRQAAGAGLLLSIAALTELRVPAMLPAIILLAWQLGGFALVRRLAWFATPIAVFWVVVFAVPDIRFALIDLNLASRRGGSRSRVLRRYSSISAPFVLVLLLVFGGRFPRSGRPYALSIGCSRYRASQLLLGLDNRTTTTGPSPFFRFRWRNHPVA